MSASNGGLPVGECETFFTTIQKPFPKLTADGKIETLKFLEAAKGVVALVEHFGPVFLPVKHDMMGNIQKLTRKFEEDQENYVYLDVMIISEKNQGKNIATDALLWLRRGLELFHSFYTNLIEHTEAGKVSEDLRPLLRNAYEETLEAYHGWMSKQLFKLVCQMCPSRKDILLALALGREDQERTVLRHLSAFLVELKINTQTIYKLYKDNGLDLEAKA